jgi:hypothetical protein
VSSDWERGYDAGYRAAHRSDVRDITSDRGDPAPTRKAKKTRKASAYSKRYGREFRRLMSKFKTKSGSWKKDGYKRLVRAAHKAARK